MAAISEDVIFALAGLGVALCLLLVMLCLCLSKKYSAVRRSHDGKRVIADNTPVMFAVTPGYDNMAYTKNGTDDICTTQYETLDEQA